MGAICSRPSCCRLQLIPLLRELAGGAKALDTRVEELSRQSHFARQMVEREALRWEREHLSGCRFDDEAEGCSDETDQVGGADQSAGSRGTVDRSEGVGDVEPPSGIRREEFPLQAFLRKGPGGEGSEQGWAGSDLPELVREELLHRFIVGELTSHGSTAVPPNLITLCAPRGNLSFGRRLVKARVSVDGDANPGQTRHVRA